MVQVYLCIYVLGICQWDWGNFGWFKEWWLGTFSAFKKLKTQACQYDCHIELLPSKLCIMHINMLCYVQMDVCLGISKNIVDGVLRLFPQSSIIRDTSQGAFSPSRNRIFKAKEGRKDDDNAWLERKLSRTSISKPLNKGDLCTWFFLVVSVIYR